MSPLPEWMGIEDLGDFKFHAIEKFRETLHTVTKASLKTEPIPTWATRWGAGRLEYIVNRNPKRRMRLGLKIRKQAGGKLTNPKSKRRTSWLPGLFISRIRAEAEVAREI